MQKMVHCEYVTLEGKTWSLPCKVPDTIIKIENQITLRKRHRPGLCRWAQCNNRRPSRWKRKRPQRGGVRYNVTRTQPATPWALSSEEQVRSTSSPRSWERILLLSWRDSGGAQKGAEPCASISAQPEAYPISTLQKCNTADLYSFKFVVTC